MSQSLSILSRNILSEVKMFSDIASAQALFRLLADFEKLSGLAINPTKTEGMWIGSLKENKTKPLGIKWPDEPIKALGVYYSYDQKLLQEKNFIEKLDSVKKTRKYLVFKGSFSLWEGNRNKIVNYSKICLCVVVADHSPGSDPRAKPTDI